MNHIERTIELANQNVERGGKPFSCVIVSSETGEVFAESPDRVAYIATREEEGRYYKDDQKYFEFENFYDEFEKTPGQRRLPMEHTPAEGGTEVYRRWQQLNSGDTE